MNLNYNYTTTIGFSTGLEFDFETIKFKSDSTLYYLFNDSEILSKSQYVNSENIFKNSEGKVYQITARKEKPIYLSIPAMILFRTEFIGYFRYFGKFGLRNSFLISSKTTDDGSIPAIGQNITNVDMISKNDLFFFKSAVGVAAGAEWNFSGSTSLVAEIGYYYGFTPLHTQKKTDAGDERNTLFTIDDNGDPLMFNNKANQNQVMLKVSILF